MASVSISHMILFIASLVIAAGVVGTVTTEVDRVNAAIEATSMDVSEDIRTDVTIVSDAGSSNVYDSGNETVTLLVKNTGTQRLAPDGSEAVIVFDGAFIGSGSIETTLHGGSGDSWGRGDVLEYTIDVGSIDTGDHRIHLTVNGDEEVFEFRHE
ncbi:flagellar protein FlaG [Halopenitus malekzadehii]|uniref:Flagellar protein FlaG n=1 Tax=Halopenitus malekzadehii TaxID=1267564 RepID=A0A1H6HWW7_9EURY|nr:flagellar protein G [Halopenitus malekzadehii]SEH38657.1 flagellar protein FlaG [Halopenitus malekzadehii]